MSRKQESHVDLDVPDARAAQPCHVGEGDLRLESGSHDIRLDFFIFYPPICCPQKANLCGCGCGCGGIGGIVF